MVFRRKIKQYGLPEEVRRELIENWKGIRNDYYTLIEEDKLEYKEHGKPFWEVGMWKVFPLRDYPLGNKMK